MMLLLQAVGALALAERVRATKYEEYVLTPGSRTIHATSIYQVNGTVENSKSLVGESDGRATFHDNSTVTLDFGLNIAGLVTLRIGDVDADQSIGLAYSESSLWITSAGSDATADAGLDEVLWFHPDGPGNYTVSREHERGAFKYLTLIHNTAGNIEVEDVSVYYTPMPHVDETQLRAYTGFFHSNDDLINRIWYAGAYTNQICTIDPKYGDAIPFVAGITSDQEGDETPPNPWFSNQTITNGTSALVDGAKRDRLVWAGDMSIAVPGIVVSYNDMISVANSLDSLFNVQNVSGRLPYAGVPFPDVVSFTYHLYTLIGVADYYLYADALQYVQDKWEAWKRAIDWSLSSIDDSGLANVTSPNDWLRFGMGGHNIEANAIFYYTLSKGISLGQVMGEDQALLDSWAQTAETLKEAANRLLWNDATGLYIDNETSTLSPQDGNSWAVVANLTHSDAQIQRISASLSSRWGTYGAPAPEARDAISPFISGFELQAHLIAGNVSAALELVRRQWGFMLDDPRMTNSTFIEGYAIDGSLHYAPYSNDPRVSHAHGWATGPTSSLTFYVGGIHLLSAGGRTWELRPRLGDLTFVDAGFATSVGTFASQVNATGDGRVTGFTFQTPVGSSGRVVLPGVRGSLRGENSTSIALTNGEAGDVPGGTYTLVLENASGNETAVSSPPTASSPVAYTGDATTLSGSILASAVGLFALLL